MRLQIIQQGNLLFQFIESLAIHGLLASIGRIRQSAGQIPGKDGGCPQKVRVYGSGLHPAPHAEQSPLSPSAHGGGIGQARRIFAVRCGLLGGIAGGDPLAGLLPAAQGVVRRLERANRARS